MSTALEETPSSDPSAEQSTDPNYIRLIRSHLHLAFIPLAFLLGLGFGFLVWGQVLVVPEAELSTRQIARIDVDPGDDPYLGPADAPITIVEFSDFSCPHCQRWHQEVSQDLLDAYPDQIRFVYKDFPIVGGGQAGFLGAQAAHCAEEQGAYWEFHNALLSGTYVLDSPGVDQAAVDLKLDYESFNECMVEARYAEEILEDFEYGAALGISSTPTFFINGIPVVGAQPLLRFIEIINGELGN